MPSQLKSPATGASDSAIGTIAIVSPTNALSSDDSYATSVLLNGESTNYLKCTNFGFSIPGRARIDGIVVEIEKKTSLTNSVTDNVVKLVKNGTVGGTNNASGAQWATSDAYSTYGSATDMWGQVWTPWDINQSNFGAVIGATAALAATASIDHMRITVYYTEPNYPSSAQRFISVGNGMSRGSDYHS